MPTNIESPDTPPYGNFKFRLKWDNNYIAGFSKVSALTPPNQQTTHQAGSAPATPRGMPGQSEYQAISLERGVTHDPAFDQWANKIWDYHNSPTGAPSSPQVSLNDFRRDFVLEVYNETGQKVIAYELHRCWPSEYTAMPELDANTNAVAIQMCKLENEGWERDKSGDTLPGS